MSSNKQFILPFGDDFLRHLQFNLHYSGNTVSAYKRDLSLYETFQKKGKNIKDFYRFLTKRGLSARSQARAVSCVRGYLRFLQSRGKSAPELKRLILPKIKTKLPRFLTFEEFKSLWQAACEGESKEGAAALTLRNHLILGFLYGLGVRVSELASLNLKDFNETDFWISVTGKGSRQRIVPLSKEIYELVQMYLKTARPVFVSSHRPHLIFNNRGNRPSRVDIWRWLKAWSLQAGFDEVKNPHSFRHGCATVLLEKGADLKSIQTLLGHLNIQTTQIYTSVVTGKIKHTIKKHHPLSAPDPLGG